MPFHTFLITWELRGSPVNYLIANGSKKVQLQFRTKPWLSPTKIILRGPQRRQRKKEVPYDQSIYDFVVYRVFVATASFIIGDEATMLRRWVSDASNSGIPILTQSSLDLSRGFLFFFFSEYLYQAPSFLHGLQLNRSTAYYYIHFS